MAIWYLCGKKKHILCVLNWAKVIKITLIRVYEYSDSRMDMSSKDLYPLPVFISSRRIPSKRNPSDLYRFEARSLSWNTSSHSLWNLSEIKQYSLIRQIHCLPIPFPFSLMTIRRNSRDLFGFLMPHKIINPIILPDGLSHTWDVPYFHHLW